MLSLYNYHDAILRLYDISRHTERRGKGDLTLKSRTK